MNLILFLEFVGIVALVLFLKRGHEEEASVFVATRAYIAQTDEDYVCATMDYITHTSGINVSLLNLDLDNRILLNAVKAFSPLKLRLGGTLQDKVTYETVGQKEPCLPFIQNSSQLFGFNSACLSLSRWDQLNNFFNQTGAVAIFGLNALTRKTVLSNQSAAGAWDSTNAESLIRYTVSKGYNIHGWELGNELSGKGLGAYVAVEQYASDVMSLQKLVRDIYNGSQIKPLVVAPGGFFDADDWYSEFFRKTTKTLQVFTYHIYNLGAGEDDQVMKRILDPTHLDGASTVYKDVKNMLRSVGSETVAWVGEAGGAYHGGRSLVTNAFVMIFWYLDQLGVAASYDTKTYCRQDLIGENYGLLDTTSFAPNPDYYSALLWHRLMGTNVLSTTVSGTKRLRSYCHCSKQSAGITLVLLNLDGKKTLKVSVSTEDGILTAPLKLSKMARATREEYHLTSPNRDLHSQTILLNGNVLAINLLGEIPELEPYSVNSLRPVKVAPYSIVFVHFPLVSYPACKITTHT